MSIENLKNLLARDTKGADIPILHGWLDDGRKKIFEKLLTGNYKTIVEIGSWCGQSALWFAERFPDSHVICIDTWLGSSEHFLDNNLYKIIPEIFDRFTKNIEKYKDRIIPLRFSSVDGLYILHLCKVKPDLIYIDGSHNKHQVYADVVTAFELFPESFIFGDDFDFPDVREAVSKVAGDYSCNLEYEVPIWYFKDRVKNDYR